MTTYTWWQWLMFFYCYCFFGWVWESCYVSVCKKRWVNRGFLHLPLLPLYGSGACAILFATFPFRDNLILLYLSGMVGATCLELVTGLSMEALFKVKYWDYSSKKINFKGVICLEASLLWGVFSVIMVKFAHAHVETLLSYIPLTLVFVLEAVISVAFIADTYESSRDALQLAQILTAMEKAKQEMQENWDRMEKELEEQKLLLEIRLEEARKVAEDQIEERILLALERMEHMRESREAMRENLMELQIDAIDLVDDMKDAAHHMAEGVRLNMVFHSDAILDQMKQTVEEYHRDRQKMFARTEELSRGMLLRNPTAHFVDRKELTKEMRSRARQWVEKKKKR